MFYVIFNEFTLIILIMKIGLLAYHAACNFGAFLQLLSTIEYIKKQGDEPIVINWIPRDFRKDYERRSLPEVRALYSDLRKQYYPMTAICETEKQVAEVIEREHINAVIIGSDAVSQHHPLRERIHFPCRRIIYISKPTSDRMYPNCFWGSFNKYLKHTVPTAIISGSSQDSKYYFIKGRIKAKMKQSILHFNYISVRDDWTQRMIDYLSDGEVVPDVTPDPVFAFNYNASHLVPSREDTCKKFRLPDDYLILSFKGNKSVSQDWIDEFQKLANKSGLACVKLPYADAPAYGDIQYSVGDAISPLDWYALIKYSKGYIGNNMHPIVTSITNGVPFYSFDNYGIPKIEGKSTNGESSKIYHILKQADLLGNRIFVSGSLYTATKPEVVLNKITSFDISKEQTFAQFYLSKYFQMMKEMYKHIKK